MAKHRTPEWIEALETLANAIDEVLGDFTRAGKPVGDEDTIQVDHQELYAALAAFQKADKKGWQSK